MTELKSNQSRNGLASIAAFLALLIFAVSIFVPCITTYRFGRPEPISLTGTMLALWESGEVWLALVVLCFTLLFPPAKLLGIIAATSRAFPLSSRSRNRLNRWVVHLTKYSMLDIFLIAVFLVAAKLEGFVRVEAGLGTYLFLTAVLLSALSGCLVRIADPVDDSERSGPARPAFRMNWARALIGPALFCAGFFVFLYSAPGIVEQIHVTRKEGLLELPQILGNPSYYLTVKTAQGPIELDTKRNTPIGNGLIWILPKAVPLENILEIDLANDGFFRNKVIDRVRIVRWQTAGQQFVFELKGRWPPGRIAGAGIMAAAGILTLAQIALGLRRYALP